ncbi:MAG: hypothetical protein ABIY47_11365, partial [Opitutaceae bacterium]
MKRWRILRAALLIALAVGGVNAQPVKALVDAVDRLWAAGNYSWEKGTERFVDQRKQSGRTVFSDSGETTIGGFTHARIRRQEMVYSNREMVLATKNGWRHTDDLTEADFSPPAPGVRSRVVKPPRVLPHEILRLILKYGRNIRAQGIAVEGDLVLSDEGISALKSYGIDGGPFASFTRTPAPPGKSTTFVVWIERGDITEFSVEFANTIILLNDP